MPLRLVEMVLDQSLEDWLSEPLDGVATEGMWTVHLGGSNILVRILVQAEDSERLLEVLQHRYGGLEEFHCVLLPVEASLPAADSQKNHANDGKGKRKRPANRMSREELCAEVQDSARLTAPFAVMAGLSAVVAAIGLVRDSLAVIIGAMVIAPLLGPNMAISLAACVGDRHMFARALRALAVGVVAGGLLAWLLGLAVEVPMESAALKARTAVGLGDFGLALASGVAGALAFTSGLSTALVGVMVAVALMPPLAAMGLMAASGAWPSAVAAGLLFMVNLVCINLAAVTTFTIQGLRPADHEDAKGALWASALLIAFCLALLIGLIWLVNHLKSLGAFL